MARRVVGRHDQGQAARVRGRDESGEIADDAAPDRDDDRLPVRRPTGQIVVEASGHRQALGALSRRNGRRKNLDAVATERCRDSDGVRLGIFVGYDKRARQPRPAAVDERNESGVIARDGDVIASFIQMDAENGHIVPAHASLALEHLPSRLKWTHCTSRVAGPRRWPL